VDNSLDACEEAGILPDILVKLTQTSESRFTMLVEDNGPGIVKSNLPKVFGKLDLAIIRMGEETGVLPKCLKDLSAFLEWREDMRATVKRAAIYPSFVVIVIVAVVGVWVGYVLPQLASLLMQMGVELPSMTRFILNLSQFVKTYWPIILLAAMLSIIGIFLMQRSKKGSVLLHQYILRLPIIGGVILNIAMARLSNNFATMYQAGMSINGIFEILAEDVLGRAHRAEPE
jgi:type IV pilus assembly protein PilC